jgi:hypothetical protein
MCSTHLNPPLFDYNKMLINIRDVKRNPSPNPNPEILKNLKNPHGGKL